MYPKALTQKERAMLKRAGSSYRRDRVPTISKKMASEMQDFVSELRDFSQADLYRELYDQVMLDSEITSAGYLTPSGFYCHDPYIVPLEDLPHYAAVMDGYDKYLCIDGTIRYRPTPEGDARFQTLYEQYRKEYLSDDADTDGGMSY